MLYYTAEQAANILQIHKVTVYKWAEAGILHGTKLNGRLWRFTDEDIKMCGFPTEIKHDNQQTPKGRNLVLPI